MKRKRMTKARRARIKQAYGHKCYICEADERPTGILQIDHWVPLMLGGSEDDDNLRPLCPSCHKKKTTSENRVRGKINRLSGKTKKRDKRKWPQCKLTSRGFEYVKGSAKFPSRPKQAD